MDQVLVVKAVDALSKAAGLKVRERVFVVEQGFPEEDEFDHFDQEDTTACHHLVAFDSTARETGRCSTHGDEIGCYKRTRSAKQFASLACLLPAQLPAASPLEINNWHVLGLRR